LKGPLLGAEPTPRLGQERFKCVLGFLRDDEPRPKRQADEDVGRGFVFPSPRRLGAAASAAAENLHA